MWKPLIGITLAVLFSFGSILSAMAESDSEGPEYEVIEESGIDDDIEGFLQSKDWQEGKNTLKNGKTILIATGAATIAADRNSKSFISSRQNAFDKAMLQAKKELAKYLEMEIGSTLSTDLLAPSESREKERIERLTREGMAIEAAKAQVKALAADAKKYSDKMEIQSLSTAGAQAERLLNAELNRELVKRGFDPNQPVAEQTIQAIIESEKFKRAISAVAKSRLVGVQAFRTFEVIPSSGRGEMGVIALWSERLENVANSLFSGDSSVIPVGTPKKSLKKQIPTNKSALLTTFGTQVKRNEAGQFAIVAYAQQAPKSKSTNAKRTAFKKAALIAQAQIRFFAGEIVAVQESLDQSEDMVELADESIKSNFDESYEEKVKAVAKNLKISGITTLKKWTSKHPLTGHTIVGVVAAWSASDMDYGRETKKGMAEEPKRSKPINKKSSNQNKINSSDPDGNEGSYEASGSSPDDDDF